MDPIQEKIQKPARPVYQFVIPKPIANGVTSVGLVQLTAREEMMAAKRAGTDPIRLVYESAKQAIVEINGQAVSLADGSVDKAFDEMGPQVRNLVMTAYGQLHTPPDEAVEGFLSSQTVRVA